MSGSTVIGNWRLFCSDDGVLWNTAHIAAEQKNWQSGTPKQYNLSGVSHFPVTGLIRGRVALFGFISSTLFVTGKFKINVASIGFARIEELTITGYFKAVIPTAINATFIKYLEYLVPSISGYASIGGRLSRVLSNYTVKSEDDICFRGRVLISGRLKGANLVLYGNFVAATRMSVTAWLNISLSSSTWSSLGGISSKGHLVSSFDVTVCRFIGSITRLTLEITQLTVFSSILIRIPITVNVELATVPLTVAMTGKVPFRIYTRIDIKTPSIISFIKALIPFTSTINLVLNPPRGSGWYALTYVSIIRISTRNTESIIYGRAGPPIRFDLALTTNPPIGKIFGIGHILVNLTLRTATINPWWLMQVPYHVYGQFVSSFDSLSFDIKLKNWKLFKADEVRWVSVPITSSIGGMTLIGGKWKSMYENMHSTEVYGYIFGLVPLVIKCTIYFATAPVYSQGTIIGRTLIRGRLDLNLAAVTVKKFIGSINVGRIILVMERFSFPIRMRTIIHAIGRLTGSLSNSAVVLYGRIACRGRLQSSLSTFTTSIRLNTPIPPPHIFGMMAPTLATVISGITIRFRLTWGRINKPLDDFILPIKLFYICRGVLSSLLPNFSVALKFYIPHFVGQLHAVAENPSGMINGHSRVLARLMLTFTKFTLNFDVRSSPVFHGRLVGIIDAYQGAPYKWKEMNGGVFTDIAILFTRLIYGRLISTTSNIWYTNIYGIVPFRVYGQSFAELSSDYGSFYAHVPTMGRMAALMGLEAIKRVQIIGCHNVGTFHSTVYLNPIVDKFIGIAAHAIEGVINLKILNDVVMWKNGIYIYPLQVSIRGRAKIYGSLRAPIAPIPYIYFRSGGGITGYILGGDTGPVDSCPDPDVRAPCRPELEARIGKYIDPTDKVYWTLRWIYGNFRMIHRFPIIGRLYSRDIELGNYLNEYSNRTYGNFIAFAAIHGTMDLFITSYSEYGKGLLIYAAFKGFTVSGPMTINMSSIRSGFLLNLRAYIVGRLAADLKTVNGHAGGFITLKGGLLVNMMPVTPSIGGRVPIHYKITFTPKFEQITTILQLHTPIRIYGVFLNFYLNELTAFAQFRGWMTATGKAMWKTEEETSVTTKFIGLCPNILGMIDPTAKLDRIFLHFVGKVPEDGENIGYTNAWFLATLSSALRGNFRARVNIFINFSLNLSHTNSAILLRTPIRIWTYWHNSLQGLSRNISGIVWPTAHPNLKLANVTSNLTFMYYVPIRATVSLVLSNATSEMRGRVPCYGTLSSTLGGITLPFGIYHCTYGWLFLQFSTSAYFNGTAYHPGLYLPREPIYTVAGEVTNTIDKNRTYFVSLYDRATCEVVQTLAGNQQVPFDYSFGGVSGGQYFVLCKPAQAAVGTRVRPVLVDLEKIGRFS